MTIKLGVIYDYATGGEPEEVVPITRRALRQIHRELSEARRMTKPTPMTSGRVTMAPLDVG
jgi:hypothetical protein